MCLSIEAPAISIEAVNMANSNWGSMEDFPAIEISQELPLSKDAVSKRKVRIKTSAKSIAERHIHRISGTEASLHTGCCRRTFMPSTVFIQIVTKITIKKPAYTYGWLFSFTGSIYLPVIKSFLVV